MIAYIVVAAVCYLIAFVLGVFACILAGERQLWRFGAALITAASLILFVIQCARIFKAVHP